MATAHLALEAALRGMRSAVGVLAQMTAERASGADRRGGDTDDDEVNMILDVAAEVAVMLALQLGSAAKVVDDVLWCDAHDTHTLYSAVWLMQPYVDEGTVARLQELCDYHRPPPVVEGGVIKSL
ncbi:hypothetical protein M885DRAFT_124624 [Pelagophyceae sp. CCMP2097]|nr:hypothetical protein M885DRAFT_124624 [Pelagophyceae sp. CCMP2097]